MVTTNIFFADNSIFYFLLFIILLSRNITTSHLYCVIFALDISFGGELIFLFFILLLGRNITTSAPY